MFIPFTIRFIKDQKDNKADTDDVLTIRKSGDNEYEWSFRDSDQKSAHVIRFDQSYRLYERFESLLRMTAADAQPPSEIQFDIPAYPTVLIKHNELNYNLPTILESASMVFNGWPECVDKSQHNLRTPSAKGLYDDMPGLLPMSDEETYDDLPDLIPVPHTNAKRRWSEANHTGRHLYF